MRRRGVGCGQVGGEARRRSELTFSPDFDVADVPSGRRRFAPAFSADFDVAEVRHGVATTRSADFGVAEVRAAPSAIAGVRPVGT